MKPNYMHNVVTIGDILDDKKFIIPSFQRNIVWKKNKRKDFIAVLRNGDPIGSILVRRNNDKYELIDGLQRISTIKDFLDHPFDYLTYEDIDDGLIRRLIELDCKENKIAFTETYYDKKSVELKKIMYDFMSADDRSYRLIARCHEYGIKQSYEIDDTINEICEKMNEKRRLDELQIPTIEYFGPEENIPNIFYNLNTGGVKLSKYETYAALWSNEKYNILDEDILGCIEHKYEVLQEKSEMEVDYSGDVLRKDGISLFEYCYAVSGLLRSEEKGFETIVGATDKSTDPIGFELLSIVLFKNVNQANKLKEALSGKSSDFMIQLKNVIIRSMGIVKKALEEICTGLAGQKLSTESLYMFYHIIGSYIIEKYEINLEEQRIEQKNHELKDSDFHRYCKLHFVKNTLSDYWQERRQVTDLARELEDLESRRRYWSNISKETWNSVLTDYFNTQKTCGKTVSYKNKIFIDFLMRMKLSDNPKYTSYLKPQREDGKYVQLDFEHIVPKKRLETKIVDLPKSQQKSYPISAVGNLCYLSVTDNRSKRDKTIYEYTKDRPSYVQNNEYLSCVVYPNKGDLDFLNYSNVDFRISYERFLNNRMNQLHNEFLQLVVELYSI